MTPKTKHLPTPPKDCAEPQSPSDPRPYKRTVTYTIEGKTPEDLETASVLLENVLDQDMKDGANGSMCTGMTSEAMVFHWEITVSPTPNA